MALGTTAWRDVFKDCRFIVSTKVSFECEFERQATLQLSLLNKSKKAAMIYNLILIVIFPHNLLVEIFLYRTNGLPLIPLEYLIVVVLPFFII